MVYRMDLKRIATEAAEKSGFSFEEVYDFLWKVIKSNHWNVEIIREKISATPGKIYIDARNMFFRMPPERSSASRWNANRYDSGADYWEGRILARQGT